MLTIVTVCEAEGLGRLTRITGSAGVGVSEVLLLFADSLEGVEAPVETTALTAAVAGAEFDGRSSEAVSK